MGCCASKDKYAEGEAIVRKVAVVGNDGVGKTCLIHRYIHDEFDEETSSEYIPTALHMDEKTVNLGNDKEVTLHIYDIGGKETFKHLRKLNYPKSDVGIVCFSVDDEQSLKDVEKLWVPEMRRICPGIPLLLAGLKIDNRSAARKFVRESSAIKVAKRHKMVGYVECSSQTNEGVEKVFQKMALEAYKRRKNKAKVDADKLES